MESAPIRNIADNTQQAIYIQGNGKSAKCGYCENDLSIPVDIFYENLKKRILPDWNGIKKGPGFYLNENGNYFCDHECNRKAKED